MAGYLCSYTNPTEDKNCLRCGAVKAGEFVKQPVTITFGDDECQIPTIFFKAQISRKDKEGHKAKPSCMKVEIEFFHVKFLVVLFKDCGKPVRVSVVRKDASSNLKDSIKSVELELPL
ncbi:predicted protein [Sclerotinia sclerotiorum 1980 UF-70]|uniref:Uncharacterized protein n=2 Tax=Sclerotinia sclerotiorum (strain ATCC 18683 / 1980 / Ss-1) TaxID=665079 RepID=A7F6V3_SCLS1|nr:predicted protein [Sclerotinia sclerotiorum 1980 UF-70]APA08391.1 hypothetical protein sscle_03g031610 [Sclerotinia sclerotiorum 1980 UF-70]EDN98474.1 predicted protein [Sclerotinia sclerotiorum 1980 UF-70]